MRPSHYGLFPLLAFALGACGVAPADDSLGVDEGEKRIKISDSEDLGEIAVGWPKGWPKGNTGFIGIGTGFSLSYRSEQIQPGVPQRFTEDTGCIRLDGAFAGGMESCNVAVKKSYRTTFDLAALKVDWDPNSTSSTLSVDFGPRPSLTVKRLANVPTNDAETVVWPTRYSAYATPVVSTLGALVLPGKYTVDFGVSALAPMNVTIAQGQYASVSAKPADKRAKLIVKTPARDLPNQARSTCIGSNTTFVVMRSDGAKTLRPEPDAMNIAGADQGTASGSGIQEWRAVPANGPFALSMFPLGPSDGAHYELVVNNLLLPLSLTAGKTQTITLERLDVDHVDVTRENGTVYQATGYYTVERSDNGSWVPMMQQVPMSYGSCERSGAATPFSASTGTGVDVLPGTYRVTIVYSTAEGSKQKQLTVTLP